MTGIGASLSPTGATRRDVQDATRIKQTTANEAAREGVSRVSAEITRAFAELHLRRDAQ